MGALRKASGKMRDFKAALNLVAILPARSCSGEPSIFEIVFAKFDCGAPPAFQNGNRDRARVNASAFLARWNALDPVNAGLVLKAADIRSF